MESEKEYEREKEENFQRSFWDKRPQSRGK